LRETTRSEERDTREAIAHPAKPAALMTRMIGACGAYSSSFCPGPIVGTAVAREDRQRRGIVDGAGS